jgi:putative glutamine amidotransferase
MAAGPRIVVTLAAREGSADRDPVRTAANARYLEAVRRQGGDPIPLDARSSAAERRRAFEAMAGLLLSGGADIAPRRYGEAPAGAHGVDEARDELEAEAWAVAAERGLPVFGICRGHQAINVFSGGRLLQHVEGHDRPSGAGERSATGGGESATGSTRSTGGGESATGSTRSTLAGSGPPPGRDALGRLERRHELRLVPGTRLARILAPTSGAGRLLVNSSHHQAVRPADLAPGLVAAGYAWSPAGEIVEALEAAGDRFVVGVQCHPERVETSPPEFERLWRVFVDACRGAAVRR